MKRCVILLAALGSSACHPHPEAAPPSDAAAPSLVSVATDAALPSSAIVDAGPTNPVPTDAGSQEPRTLYLGPRPTLADVCADADAWYAKQSHRPRSHVCLLSTPRTLSGDRFLEAASYSIPAPPHPFSERPGNAYEPFLALRTSRGWFVQPSDSFSMSAGRRNVWIPLDRIAERDGELAVVHLETRNGQTEERALHCTLTDAGAPSCTSFASFASFTSKGDAAP